MGKQTRGSPASGQSEKLPTPSAPQWPGDTDEWHYLSRPIPPTVEERKIYSLGIFSLVGKALKLLPGSEYPLLTWTDF